MYKESPEKKNPELNDKSDPFTRMEEMREKLLEGLSDNLGYDDHFFDTPFENKKSDHFKLGFGNFDKIFEETHKKSGAYICQTYSNKTEIGPDGKPIVERLVKNEITKLGSDGKKIIEKTELYNHSGTNIERVVKERGLGDKGIKITRENKGGEHLQHKELVHLKEEEVSAFNKEWKVMAKKENLYRPTIKFSDLKVNEYGQNDRNQTDRNQTDRNQTDRNQTDQRQNETRQNETRQNEMRQNEQKQNEWRQNEQKPIDPKQNEQKLTDQKKVVDKK